MRSILITFIFCALTFHKPAFSAIPNIDYLTILEDSIWGKMNNNSGSGIEWQGYIQYEVLDTDVDTLGLSIVIEVDGNELAPDSVWGGVNIRPGGKRKLGFTFRTDAFINKGFMQARVKLIVDDKNHGTEVHPFDQLGFMIDDFMDTVYEVSGLGREWNGLIEVPSFLQWRSDYQAELRSETEADSSVEPDSNAVSFWDEFYIHYGFRDTSNKEEPTVDETANEILGSGVAGYYSFFDKKLVVIVGDLTFESMTAEEAFDDLEAVIVHEGFHAAQDQIHNLSEVLSKDSLPDYGSNAVYESRRYVIEGDAKNFEHMWNRYRAGQPFDEYMIDNIVYDYEYSKWHRRSSHRTESHMDAAFDDLYWKNLIHPYIYGPWWVATFRNASSWKNFDTLFSNYPANVSQVYHLDKLASRETQTFFVPMELDRFKDTAAYNWAVQDQIGEHELELIFHLMLQNTKADTLLENWNGDMLSMIYHKPEKRMVVVNMIDIKDSTDAQEFFDTYKLLITAKAMLPISEESYHKEVGIPTWEFTFENGHKTLLMLQDGRYIFVASSLSSEEFNDYKTNLTIYHPSIPSNAKTLKSYNLKANTLRTPERKRVYCTFPKI
jgi:hypothetical protein